MAWLAGYSYRKSITLSRASGAVTNYQMILLLGESSGATGADVDCGGLCASDFDDIRFTTSDGTTLLDYYIDSISGTTPNQVATIWIEFDSIGTSATSFYMYYGNAEATAVSNGANTFIFFEDFNALSDGDLNGQHSWSGSTAWDVQTGVKYEGAKAVQVANVSNGLMDQSITVTSFNAFIEMQMRGTNTGLTYPLQIYLMETANYIVGASITGGNVSNLKAGTTWESIKAASNNTWYKVRIAVDSASTHKMWIDDVLQTITTSNSSNVSSTINKIELQQYNASGADVFYLDVIKVGQYLATEPAWGTWGVQEKGAKNYLHARRDRLNTRGVSTQNQFA